MSSILTGIRIAWVEHFWDGVKQAHCWYGKKYCVACYDDETDLFDVYELIGGSLIRALAHRKMFEDTVGYHFSYLPSGKPIVPAFKPENSFHGADWSTACRDIDALLPGLPPDKMEENVFIGQAKSIWV